MKRVILFLLSIIFVSSTAHGAEITNKSVGGLIDVLTGPTTSILFGGGAGNAPAWVTANDSHNHTASTVTDFDTEVSNNSSVSANTAKATNATHTGEVTGSGALTITSNVIDADNLKVTGNGTTSQYLRSDGDGTFTWATPTDNDTTYPYAINSVGSNGQVWKSDGSGIGGWGTDNNTTYSVGNNGLTAINFTSTLNSKLSGIGAGADITSVIGGTAISVSGGTTGDATVNAVLASGAEAQTGTVTNKMITPDTLTAAVREQSWTQSNSLYIATDMIRARDTGGLQLLEDSGTSGIFVKDTNGWVGLNSIPAAPFAVGHSVSGEFFRSEYTGDNDYYNSFNMTYSGVGPSYNKLTFDISSGKGTQASDVLTLQGDGCVGIGTDSPASSLEIRQDGNGYEDGLYIFDGVNTGWHILEGANDELLYACDTSLLFIFDKYGNFGVGALPNGNSKLTVGGFTGTASYSYVKINTATGSFYYATSTEKNKEDITELTPDWAKLLALTPVSFTDKTSGLTEPGLLAEDLDNAGLNDLVLYDEESRPNGVKYELVSLYLLSAVRNLVWPQLSAEEKQTVIQTARGIWKRQWRRDNVAEVEIPEEEAFEVVSVTKEYTSKEVPETEAMEDVAEVRDVEKEFTISQAEAFEPGGELKPNVRIDPKAGGYKEKRIVQQTFTKRKIKRQYSQDGDRYYRNLSTGETTKYRIKDGKKEAYKEPVYPVITLQERKLKKNVRMDPDTGEFYRKIIPGKEDAEKAAGEKFETEKPNWLKSVSG